jgi:hypothetical protein
MHWAPVCVTTDTAADAPLAHPYLRNSLEIALMASGEDDVLSYVFQKMVAALRDGTVRDMKCVPRRRSTEPPIVRRPSLTPLRIQNHPPRKETMPRFLLRGLSFRVTRAPLLTAVDEPPARLSPFLAPSVIDMFLPMSPWSTYHDVPRHPNSEYTKVSMMAPADAQAYHLGLNPLRAMMSDDALEDGGSERPREGQKGWDDEAGRMLWRMDWKEKVRRSRCFQSSV